MARINFEDDIESRSQFWKLYDIVKDRDAALGKLVRFFRLAQKFFGRGEPIEREHLENEGLSCMIDSGWAIPWNGGYQALGAERQFAWYVQRIEAGKLGGRPRLVKNMETENNRPVIPDKRPEPAVNPLTLTLSLNKENQNSKTENPTITSLPKHGADLVKAVMVERGVTEKLFIPWIKKAPNQEWLEQKLIELHAEVNDNDFTNQKPFAVRYRQYVQASLDRLANPRYTADTSQQTDTSWRKLAGIPEEKS